MKVRITDDCVACELCVETCPEMFEMGEDYAEPIMEDVPDKYQSEVEESAELCPTDAIIIED